MSPSAAARIGWTPCAVSALAVPAAAIIAHLDGSGVRPREASDPSEWIWMTSMLLSTFLLLLFPAGRLPSRRWRPVAWLAGVGMAGCFLQQAFAPGQLEFFPRNNPLGLDGAGGEIAKAVGFSFALVLLLPLAP